MTTRRVSLRSLVSVSLATFATLATLACKHPEVGGQCIQGQALCENPMTVLVCVAGSFTEVHCGGGGGCTMVESRVTCDNSIAAVGDVCVSAGGQSHACTADKTQSLVCTAGKFEAVQTCHGAKGCRIKGDSVTCDSSSGATKGDLCTTPDALACATDGKSRFVCKEGKYALDRFCKGPKGCHDADMQCDGTIADEGDSCSTSGLIACAVDGSRELVCESGAFVGSISCKKGICKILSETKVECR